MPEKDFSLLIEHCIVKVLHPNFKFNSKSGAGDHSNEGALILAKDLKNVILGPTLMGWNILEETVKRNVEKEKKGEVLSTQLNPGDVFLVPVDFLRFIID